MLPVCEVGILCRVHSASLVGLDYIVQLYSYMNTTATGQRVICACIN